MLNKSKLTFNINSLLYNHDNDAVNTLQEQFPAKYNQYKHFLNKPVEVKTTNKITMDIHTDDSIDYIKKKLSIKLFNDMKKSSCLYCFNDTDTEVVSVKVKSATKNIFDLKIGKKKETKEDDIDLDDIDLDDLDIDDLDLDDLDLEDVSVGSMDISDISEMSGGAKNTSKNVFICNHCKKIYSFDDYFKISEFDKYTGVFPFPEIISFTNKNNLPVSFQVVDNMRKQIEYSFDTFEAKSPFHNINNIDRKSLMSKKNTRMTKFLKFVLSQDMKYQKNVLNKSFITYQNINEVSLDMFYFPEMALYMKENNTQCLDLFSKLFWPYLDIPNYVRYFNKTDEYVGCLNSTVNMQKYKIDNTLYKWNSKYENYEKILNYLNELKDDVKIEYFSNKIFYKVNDNNQINTLINFQSVYHLFELDEEIPYLSSYIPEETIILEKIYKPLEEQIKQKDWKLQQQNIINFRLRLPKGIFPDDDYFHVNLYPNMKLEVNVTIPTKLELFVTKEILLIINEKVNGLIDRLNKTNIFNFESLKINNSNIDFNYADNEVDSQETTINSMNFFLKIKNKIPEGEMIKMLRFLNSKMNIVFHKDFGLSDTDFRFRRINNINMGDITDKFIFDKYNILVDEIGSEDQQQILHVLVKSIQEFFDKSYEESLSILYNYRNKYKSFMIKPIGYGIYFNIKEPKEWQDIESSDRFYKVNIFGLRNYEEFDIMKSFINKLFVIFEKLYNNKMDFKLLKLDNIEQIEKEIVKKELYTKLHQEKFQCNIDLRTVNDDMKVIKDKAQIKELNKQKKLVENRDKELNNLIAEQKTVLRASSVNQIVTYLSRLQDHFTNLKFQCPECKSAPSSKHCMDCDKDVDISSYSKQCQKKRQPMGTGAGVEPEIIDFDEKYELNRFKELNKVTCNVSGSVKVRQQGGASPKKYTLDAYKTWGKTNKPEIYGDVDMNISNCMYNLKKDKSKSGYSIKDLHKLAKDHYDVKVDNKGKKELCNIIIDKTRSADTESPTNKDSMITKLTQKMNAESKQDRKNLYAFLINYITLKKTIFGDGEIVLDLVSKQDEEIKSLKYLKKFNMGSVISSIEKIDSILPKNFKILLLIFEIYSVSPMKNNTIGDIYNYIFGSVRTPQKMKKDLANYFDIFSNKYLSETLASIDKKEEVENIDEFLKKSDLLIRKNKNGNIIQSTLNYRGKSVSCPNFQDKDNNALVGFLDMEQYDNSNNYSDTKIRNIVCKPCCFAPKKDENNKPVLKKNYMRNMLFCKGKLSWGDYLKQNEEDVKVENYISSILTSNKTNAYGKLPELSHSFFNNYINLYETETKIKPFLFSNYKNNLLKSAGFVLKGINQGNYKYMNLLSSVFNKSAIAIISNIEKYLKSNSSVFNSLNEGKLVNKFGSIAKYIEYLKTEDVFVDIEWVIDVMKYPIDKDYKTGFNIIVIKEQDGDLKLRTFEHINYEDYYNTKNNFIFVYEYEDNDIEPIVMKNLEKKDITIFSREKKYTKINAEQNKVMSSFLDMVDNWVSHVYSTSNITLDKMKNIIKVDKQVVDIFNKCSFAVSDKIIYPVSQSSYDPFLSYEGFKTSSDLNKYKKSVKETISYINDFADKTELTGYSFAKVITDKSGKNIVAIELTNKLAIPTIAEENSSKHRVSSLKLMYSLNNAIYKNEKPEKYNDFLKEEYDFESYERIIVEFSNYLSNHTDIKETMERLITADTFESNEHVKQIIKKIFTDITVYKESELIDYKKIDTIIEDNNIRKLCEVNNDDMCVYDKTDKHFKLIIPFDKKNLYEGILLESIKNNETFKEKIFNNNVNIIINTSSFKNNEKHIFIKKRFNFV